MRHQHSQQASAARGRLTRSISDQAAAQAAPHNDTSGLRKSMTLNYHGQPYRNHGPPSPSRNPPESLSLRDVHSDSSNPRFPLTNIDNPSDIAQELSNLQALRRLSMDVGNGIDPDMPPMTFSAIPAIAPTGDDDENDPSRLLWVPARVHPELAPTEFKSFLENRVQSIRRRSGDSHLSGDGDLGRSDSDLKRRKSMLSHQIDNADGSGAVGYVDGAERLERQRSQNSQHSPELSLDELVKDPTRAVQKLAQESQLQHGESANPDDMPILPMAPGMGLRRSTRTTYRKGGSLRYGDRSGSGKRVVSRQQDESIEDESSPVNTETSPRGYGLARVQSEPITENYSRPNRSVRRQHKFSQESPDALAALEGNAPGMALSSDSRSPVQETLTVRSLSGSAGPGDATESRTDMYPAQADSAYAGFPERSSSQNIDTAGNDGMFESSRTEPGMPVSSPPLGYPGAQSPYMHQHQRQSQPQSLSEGLASSPAVLGSGVTRTDALTFIPTLTTEERKWDKKSKKDRDDDSSSVSSRSSGWKWFKSGSDDKDKKKDESKRSKARALVEKAQDNVRLDVLQTSIDKSGRRSRESLVLDRDSFDGKLQEERRKESNRKSESKKDKDGSIFSSIFGGSKKKEEKEKTGKKSQFLHVLDEPQPYKPLQPDVDYNWTRFPLLEERAIYRMAHIKLANPRRPLLSQVLLSNFMYSYLAIVQAMHPQMNIPISPQQKRQEEEARRKQQEQEYLAQQGLDPNEDHQDSDQYSFEYHRVSISST